MGEDIIMSSSRKAILKSLGLFLGCITAIVIAFEDVVFNTWFIGFAYGSILALGLATWILASPQDIQDRIKELEEQLKVFEDGA